MSKYTKHRNVNFRLDFDTEEKLNFLKSKSGLNTSRFIRFLIHDRYHRFLQFEELFCKSVDKFKKGE